MRMRFKKRKLRRVALLPTLITLANGICGILAIMKIGDGIKGQTAAFEQAAWLILAAMIFDVLDGKIARLTGTASRFGGQLDSLCDLVTFGVAPAFLVKAICTDPASALFPERMVTVFCVFYAAGAAVRLARFNVEAAPDEKFHVEFAGLPTPAAAGVVAASIIPWTEFGNEISSLMVRILPLVMFFMGLLMVSRIRYAHLVNKVFRGFKPFATFVELATAVILFVLLHEFAIFLLFFAYMITGPVFWIRDILLGRAPMPEHDPLLRQVSETDPAIASPSPAEEKGKGQWMS